MTTFRKSLLLLAPLALLMSGDARAQEARETVYRIGVGDRLRVSVWQEPTLDREVEVGIDSTIVLPLVGPIRAGGYTPAELSRILTDRYSLYKRDISQVEVVVVEYNSREIFVIGEISVPGRYTFQEIPDLWNVIMTAGGPGTAAYLSEVRILRGEGETRRSIPVDLNAYLLGGDRGALPRLQPGDTVYIPRTNVLGVDAFADKVVYVYGEVARPGMYMVGSREDLVGALLLAGGLTPDGDQKRIRLVRKDGGRRVVRELDLEDFLRRGDERSNPPLKGGDTIEIGASRGTSFRRIWEQYSPTLTILTTTFTAALVYDRLANNR
ncbi:MAG: polysaccharide biosynthesis/export family protein [Candidatus Eisenbacteria bacterium]